MKRRHLLQSFAGAAGSGLLLSDLASGQTATPAFTEIEVWKDPNCGCCKQWVAHLQKNGFQVTTHDVADTAPFRQKLDLPAKFGACHSARVASYALEGHVPAQDIRRLLREKPAARGLAVPGMPVGSPGMEMGNARDAYDVLLVLSDGNSRVYRSYPAMKS